MKRTVALEDFELLKVLGRGALGKVKYHEIMSE